MLIFIFYWYKSSGKTSVLLDAVPVEQGSRLSIA